MSDTPEIVFTEWTMPTKQVWVVSAHLDDIFKGFRWRTLWRILDSTHRDHWASQKLSWVMHSRKTEVINLWQPHDERDRAQCTLDCFVMVCHALVLSLNWSVTIEMWHCELACAWKIIELTFFVQIWVALCGTYTHKWLSKQLHWALIAIVLSSFFFNSAVRCVLEKDNICW